MRIHSLFIIISISLLTSCGKFLDVKPKGKLIPTELADFDHLLDNADIVQYPFMDNNSGSVLGYMTDNIFLSDAVGNINYKARNSANLDRFYAHIFRGPYKNPNTLDYFWDWGAYRSMKYYNNVIDGVSERKNESNAADADMIMSQAYMGRAWVYLNMAMVYGPVYKPGGNNSVKTIPYLTSSDAGSPAPDLSTQEEVFSKVLADLHKALPSAPATTNYPSRPTKIATQTMLAYYHLFTRKYDSVAYYANLAWTAAAAAGADKVLYDFNALSYSDPVNPLSSAIKSPDNKINLPNSREIIFFRNTDMGAGRINPSTSVSYPSDEFINIFDAAKDLRYKYYLLTAPGYKTTYNSVVYDDGNRVQYYRGVTAGITPKFQMTSGFTYPELLLMRAEGYARANKLTEAMADLNLLRQYRFVTGTPAIAMPASQDEVIRLVLEERRRELPVGHIKRFMDLKRFTLDTGKPWSKTKIVHQVGAQTFEANIDSQAFVLPISNTILNFNPNWGIPLDTRPF